MKTTITITPQQEQLEKIKSAAQRKFESIQAEASELSLRCTKLEIADENTLSIGTQLLSAVSDINKKVDAKRKELKAPYFEAGKSIDDIASRIMDPMQESIAMIKSKLKLWNDAQAKILVEAQKEAEKKYTLLKQIEEQLNQKIKLAQSSEACQNLIDSINEKFPAAEKFEKYADEAAQVKKKFLALLSTRKEMLMNASIGDADKVLAAVEQAEAIQQESEQANEVIEEKRVEIRENITVAKSKTRKQWKFEVVDETKLAKTFLSFDTAKAREYMNANKATWGKGITLGGVRFYEDEVPIA